MTESRDAMVSVLGFTGVPLGRVGDLVWFSHTKGHRAEFQRWLRQSAMPSHRDCQLEIPKRAMALLAVAYLNPVASPPRAIRSTREYAFPASPAAWPCESSPRNHAGPWQRATERIARLLHST